MKSLHIFALFFIAFPLLAQTTSMPSISSPSMPSVSSFPTISSTSASQPQKQKTDEKPAAAKDTSSNNEAYLTAASLANLSTSFLGGGTSQNKDIISNLLNNTNNENQTTNVLLQQILTQLENMQKEIDEKPVFNSIQEKPKTFEEPPQNGAKIIRFSANGYNLLSTCREIFSSEQSNDGSFLITGDRKYLSNNQTRTETFYLLFNKISAKTYDVAVTVIQDYQNSYSFLYQLSGKMPLTAYATGNLISLTVNEPEWKFDMLIDIADMN
ncbi:MAG: hypothetical protein MJ159_01760 [Treponemataceae bacterium]|nr:hypothetical protein [Treponemataceae bacterium]